MGEFVGRFAAAVCLGMVDALKAPRPARHVRFDLDGTVVTLVVDGSPVPMEKGFARVIVHDTLRGMLQHLKGLDPAGVVRIETTLSEGKP